MKRWVVLVTMVAFCGVAQAGEKERQQTRQEIFEKVSKVDFTDAVNVEGELVKPTGVIIDERPPAVFQALFHPRTEFDLEMKRSVHEVK